MLGTSSKRRKVVRRFPAVIRRVVQDLKEGEERGVGGDPIASCS